MSNNKYRPEIDGLRAIAVVSVILYHAQFIFFGADWFEGGFIGVDIFFVISGYLISRLMLVEIDKYQTFNFLNFYTRRARRILPVLFFVMLVSIPFAWSFLLPSAFVEYSKSLISSLFFGSNFFFYHATTEYGANSSLLKPFLHTWSLSVEEQFYIIFPIALLLAHKLFKKHILVLLLAAFLFSFQFSIFMSGRNPDFNFYLPFSRFWEILAGSLLAYFEIRHGRVKNKILSDVFPIIGFYLIVYSILYFDADTLHPGFITLIPVIGVSLIIAFSSENDLVGKTLAARPLVAIGLISYSLYLWHFPVFAFVRINAGFESNSEKIVWIALVITLSICSYLFVEKKFRQRSFIQTNKFWFITLCISTLIAMSNIWVIKKEGFKYRSPTIKIFENYNFDNKYLDKTHLEWAKNYNKVNPAYKSGKINVSIVGNSHARDLLSAFVRNQDKFEEFFFNRGDVPQISCFDKRFAYHQEIADRFFASDKYHRSDLILVSTRFRDSQNCHPKRKEQAEASDFVGLRDLIEKVKSDGKKIIVFGNNAEVSKINGKLITDYLFDGLIDKKGVTIKEVDDLKRKSYQLTWNNIRPYVELSNNKIRGISFKNDVPYIDKVSFLCKAGECITLTPDGYKILWDSDHFTAQGAKFFGHMMHLQGVKETLVNALK